jgi:hypothetical protein
MRKKFLTWLGRDFVELSGEAKPGASASSEASELFRRFDQELKTHKLSLDNTVRTRLWGRDRESRDLGSDERVKVLSGKARSASSSYIASDYFDSDAKIAVDLLAMKPSRQNMEKRIVEYDPPIVPIRFLVYDSVVVLSGVTTVLPTLEEQLDNILPRITGSLKAGGSSWERVARVPFICTEAKPSITWTDYSRNASKRRQLNGNTALSTVTPRSENYARSKSPRGQNDIAPSFVQAVPRSRL